MQGLVIIENRLYLNNRLRMSGFVLSLKILHKQASIDKEDLSLIRVVGKRKATVKCISEHYIGEHV